MNYFESTSIKKNLYILIKLAKADADKRFAEHDIGITPLQFGVLAMTKSKPITLNEIAHECNFKAPSLVPVIDALEDERLLERKNDADDRRKTQLVITKKV